jgi:hypothetical protein
MFDRTQIYVSVLVLALIELTMMVVSAAGR